MERTINFDNDMRVPLKKWKEDMEEIAGEWNGDESGMVEDRANAANDAIEAIDRLEECLNFLGY